MSSIRSRLKIKGEIVVVEVHVAEVLERYMQVLNVEQRYNHASLLLWAPIFVLNISFLYLEKLFTVFYVTYVYLSFFSHFVSD